VGNVRAFSRDERFVDFAPVLTGEPGGPPFNPDPPPEVSFLIDDG